MMNHTLLRLPPIVLALVSTGCATGGGGDDGYSGHAGNAAIDGSAGGSGGDGGSGNGGSGGAGLGGSGSGTGGDPGSVCFLHDCTSDAECAGCPNNKLKCETNTKRCVVCLPSDPPGVCGAGKICSQYGTCIPDSMVCPVDANGVPTVNCTIDDDCFACDPDHQVCDTATHRCVTCSDTNKYACEPTELCKNGVCVDKCPSPCTTDADCAQCGTLANPGNACNQNTHHCGECSDTVPCKDNKVCGPQGMCIEVCGALNQPKGTCSSDAECSGCEGDVVACHVPINGGVGKCGLPAEGCSDIPGNFAVLPEPWSSVTNLCSNDSDCNGVGLDLNVGKLLRDITGLDQINDATLQYGMNVCASVTVGILGQSISCGVCVPCREDADCEPIKVDPLLEQAFGPAGSIAAKALIKAVWGDAPHELQMYCEPVLGEFGVCAPCVDFLHECAVSNTEGAQCNSDWDCAAGERCDKGQCTAYLTNCFGGSDCDGGQICAWNGDGYCCRPPFTGTKTCFSDAECVPQVCAYNGQGFFCTDPVACN